MRRSDPRVRQTLNQISQTLESANLNTQASLYTFSESYLAPCLSSLNHCLEASCYPCIGARRDAERRLRNRGRMGRSTQRGRPELSFDFYDDWDDEEGEGAGLLGGWGNDELDRLLAGSGAGEGLVDQQPGRRRAMSYGSRGVLRKKNALPLKDGGVDPTIIPNSSMFGFLERLPWRIRGRGVRYRPSAADLQDNPGRKRMEEGEVLIEESEGEETVQRHRRQRSGTNESESTTNSLSSRGDLFPSEDEDDAVPLDDEFAMALERRTTGQNSDDVSTGKAGRRRTSGSRASIKTGSSRDTRSTADKKRGTSITSTKVPEEEAGTAEMSLPSMDDLKREEERVRTEEEAEIERKCQNAQRLAVQRGLSVAEETTLLREDPKPPDDAPRDAHQMNTPPHTPEQPSQTVGEKPVELMIATYSNKGPPPQSPTTTSNKDPPVSEAPKAEE